MQTAAGVKGISGEIKGDFRQGFEPRSPGFGAESKPGSAGCRSQRAQLSPLLCAAGNSPLASAREQCTASCLPRGRRETRRTRVPRAGTRGRVLGDRGGGGSTDRQAARRSDPPSPAATLRLSRELAAPALCLAREEVCCAAPEALAAASANAVRASAASPGPLQDTGNRG